MRSSKMIIAQCHDEIAASANEDGSESKKRTVGFSGTQVAIAAISEWS